MKFRSYALLLAATLLAAPLLRAATPAATDPRIAIAAKMQGVKAEDLHATPIPGIYELLRGTDAAYVSPDGKYAILGDLYETGTNNDLTENRRRDQRLKMLATIPEAQMVVFGPDNAKHTITVFTDMDW